MNILFVCSRNKWRSATAETILKTTVNTRTRCRHCAMCPNQIKLKTYIMGRSHLRNGKKT